MDVVVSIIAALVAGGLVAAFNWFANRRKTGAEIAKLEAEIVALKAGTAKQISEAWEKLIKPLEDRIDLLECGIKSRDKDLMRLRTQMKELEKENQDLRQRLRDLENGKK